MRRRNGREEWKALKKTKMEVPKTDGGNERSEKGSNKNDAENKWNKRKRKSKMFISQHIYL